MSLSQLRREVNSIQHRLTRARRVAEDYCDFWADLVSCKKLPPGPFRLLKKLFKYTRSPRHFAAADHYLNQCREQRHLPHPDGILFRLPPKETDLGLISYLTLHPVKY